MSKEIKYFLIVFFSVLSAFFVYSFIDSQLTRMKVESAFEQLNDFFIKDTKRLQKDIDVINKNAKIKAVEVSRKFRESMAIKLPKQNPKIATLEYTKPRKSNISLRDKACNDAIFKVMSDKSEEAKTAKNELCAHNLK